MNKKHFNYIAILFSILLLATALSSVNAQETIPVYAGPDKSVNEGDIVAFDSSLSPGDRLRVLWYDNYEEDNYQGSIRQYLDQTGYIVTYFADSATGYLDLNNYLDYDVVVAEHTCGSYTIKNLQKWLQEGKGYVALINWNMYTDTYDAYIRSLLNVNQNGLPGSESNGYDWSPSQLYWSNPSHPIANFPNSGLDIKGIVASQYCDHVAISGGINIVEYSPGMAALVAGEGYEGAGRVAYLGTNFHGSARTDPETRKLVENMIVWAANYNFRKIVSYEWDFDGDGGFDYIETASSAPDGMFDGKTTHIYGDDGQYVVTFRVTDDTGATGTDTLLVTVLNVKPSLRIVGGVATDSNFIITADYNARSYFIDITESGTLTSPQLIDDKYQNTYGVGIGDFDNDGDLDALVGDSQNTWYYEKLGDDNSFATAVSIDSKTYTYRMDFAEADFNNDGNLDAIMAAYANYEFSLYLGNGDGTFTTRRISAPYGIIGMDAGDFNGDGNMDFVAAGWGGSRGVNLYFGNGDGTFQIGVNLYSGTQSWGVSAGDFNNDGTCDLIFGYNPARFYPGNGDGSFGSPITLFGNVYSLAEADTNSDGYLDVVYTDGYNVYLRRGNGDGTFTNPVSQIPVSYDLYSIAAGSGSSIPEVNEGEQVDFNAVFSDPGWLDTHSAIWSWGDGTPSEAGSLVEENIFPDSTGSLSVSHAFGDDGFFTVSVLLTDDDGGSLTRSIKIKALNVPPVADAGDDQVIDEGTPLTFDASNTFDPGYLDILSFSWDFGDGTTGSGRTPTHTYVEDGVYTVTLTVTDDEGASDTDTLIVTVLNVAPIVNAGDDICENENKLVKFTGSASDPGVLDVLTYEWDLDYDGVNFDADAVGETVSHLWVDDWEGDVALRVNDDDGGVTIDVVHVKILNVAPTAIAGDDQTADEGTLVSFFGSGTDVSPEDTLSYSWDFGDGTTATGKDAIKVYADNGVYTVTLTVTDDNGGIGTDNLIVTVNNVAPIANAGEDQTCTEGDTVHFAGIASDQSPVDTLDYVWEFGDGSTVSGTLAPTHVYMDDGVYTVTLTVTDDDGGVTTDTLKVTIDNAAPVLSEITARLDPVQVDSQVIATATFTDDGISDTHSGVWDWGDGTTSVAQIIETGESGQVHGSHAYASAGIYTVTLTITDDDDGSDGAEFRYIVVYDPSGGFVTGGGWINSPSGAYVRDPELTGKATFAFVSKYLKGAKVPTGNTEFIFHAGNLEFHSSSYDWLVVSGNNAKYKGTGTIKGFEGEYTFMITVTDGDSKGSPDLFRIKIWDKSTGEIIYDNGMGLADDEYGGTAISGGSIIVHRVK